MPILANIIQEAFSPLISLFEAVLVFIHDHAGISWGLAIVGLTVIVRAVMMPATFSQFRSMRKMQLVAPELKALKEKYKDDKQRQQEEMMKLYREKGINPFASCLPLVLQLPVFISLFYMLRTDLKKHICGPASCRTTTRCTTRDHERLASARQIHRKNQLPERGPGLGEIPVRAGHHGEGDRRRADRADRALLSSQVVSTLLMSASAEPSQRWMMLGLPLVFVVILLRYPAGLLIYWITTNVWTIVQGYFVRRRIGPPPAPAWQGIPPPTSGGSSSTGERRRRWAEGRSGGPAGEPALRGRRRRQRPSATAA